MTELESASTISVDCRRLSYVWMIKAVEVMANNLTAMVEVWVKLLHLWSREGQ